MMLLPLGSGSASEADHDPESTEATDERLPEKPLRFEEVYDTCFPFVWRTVRRLGVPDEAVDDVCQEVFVIVYRRLSEFEGRAKVETWIYRIIANTVRNHRRTFRRRSPQARSVGGTVEADEVPGVNPGPEAKAQRREAVRLAREILMDLREPHRIAFSLVELEGMSYQEAAEALGESVHAVRARVRAARAQFERHARRLQNLSRWRSDG